jgi:hypothetical protein
MVEHIVDAALKHLGALAVGGLKAGAIYLTTHAGFILLPASLVCILLWMMGSEKAARGAYWSIGLYVVAIIAKAGLGVI